MTLLDRNQSNPKMVRTRVPRKHDEHEVCNCGGRIGSHISYKLENTCNNIAPFKCLVGTNNLKTSLRGIFILP